MQGVYQITNKTNGKKYIGSSVEIKKRWGAHKRELNGGYHVNPHLQSAWNKYGKDAFTFEILEETSNTLEREQWYLDNVVEWGFDYNIGLYVTNGMKGRKHTKESKRKISENNVGFLGRKHTEESKRKMSENHVGTLGRKHTEESKRKMSEAATGRTLSEETKRKLSEVNKGRTHTEEAKRKMSEANRGENHPSAKLTYKQVWEIHTLYATGNFTQKQLSRKFSISKQQMSRIVRGKNWPHVYKKFHGRNHEREK